MNAPLSHALRNVPADPVGERRAFNEAARKMERWAPASIFGQVRYGAGRLRLRTFDLISDRVYGSTPFGKRAHTIIGLLVEAEEAYRAQRALGRAGSWAYDGNRLLGLASIVVELRRRVIAAGGRAGLVEARAARAAEEAA